MIKHGELSEDKGAPTCPTGEVTPSGGAFIPWSAVRNNANNAWNVNMNNGNCNNNNVNNRNVAVGVSELSEDEMARFLNDEEECYKNKHASFDAARYHYHLALVYKMALEVKAGSWQQGSSIVFAIEYPTMREVWAADYGDRILHHDVAPVLSAAAEQIHTRNKDVSHGNRIGHSAHTAALQIQQNMLLRPDGYVGKRDLSGFFMSIPRDKACAYIISEIGPSEKNELICKLILHNPTIDCKIQSPMEMMNKIPRGKSLFFAKKGCGLPIGNFYSQLVANAYLGPVDALACAEKWQGRIGYTRFVDDICVVADSVSDINEFFAEAEVIIQELGLALNARKVYMQPVRHGVSFCGRTIHAHGIYINNRTVRACKNNLNKPITDLRGLKHLIDSLNSYYGFFKHCKTFNIQNRIANKVREKYGKYIETEMRKGQIVFKLAKPYTRKEASSNSIDLFINNKKLIHYEIRKRIRRCA